ncbi:MAG: TetR/AcrR family transcriptional regulator [Rhodococcus sp.]|nr:TetR/AcrR family transcriptional regulator [Rhodococcus sp. (in: high G+C Gram-positive bacteria)]
MATPRPRARLLAAIIPMVQECGVHAAGLTELLARSNTSRNSLYQHFPAGKGELVEAATRIVSRVVQSHLSAMADKLPEADSAEQWLDELFAFWREPLEASDYRLGSFMLAAALDETNAAVQDAAGQAFSEWTNQLANGLVSSGFADDAARSMAGLLISAIEGAIVLSRAQASSQPFDDARTQLSLLLSHQRAAALVHP